MVLYRGLTWLLSRVVLTYAPTSALSPIPLIKLPEDLSGFVRRGRRRAHPAAGRARSWDTGPASCLFDCDAIDQVPRSMLAVRLQKHCDHDGQRTDVEKESQLLDWEPAIRSRS